MTRQFIPALLISSLAPLAGQAASLYDFSSALHEAQEHSPAYQKSEAAKEEASWKKREAAAAFLPTLKVSANHFFTKKFQVLQLAFNGTPTTFPQIFPTTSATLDGTLLLFDGLANIRNYQAGSRLEDAATAEYEWAAFQLEQDVKLAYMKVVAAKQIQEVSNQNLKTLQNHLEQVKALKKGGIATNYDILRVEAQLSQAEAENLDAGDNVQIAQEKLGQTLGLNEPADVKDNALETPASLEKVKSMSFDNSHARRRDLQALEYRVQAADLRESAEKVFWVPKISLSGQYILYNNRTDTINDWDNYHNAWGVGFFLSWDIFNWAEVARSRQEAYRSVQADKSLQMANQSAPVDFAFWKKRYLYSATLYQARKVDQDRAQETLRLAQAGFRAGVRTTTDVLDAELELFRARAGIVTALMNCTEAKLKLELSQGEHL